jgi:hypothetical protein
MQFFSLPFIGLFLLLATAYITPAQASCAMTGCPTGQSCVPVPIDPYTSVYECVDDPEDPDPAPEMSVMMLPVALGAAGLLAVRSRRKAMKKKNTPNTPST